MISFWAGDRTPSPLRNTCCNNRQQRNVNRDEIVQALKTWPPMHASIESV